MTRTIGRAVALPRLRFAGLALLVLALGACRAEAAPDAAAESGATPAAMAGGGASPSPAAGPAAPAKPPVIELQQVVRHTGVDSATAARLAPHIAALNEALVSLAAMHREHDQAQLSDSKHEIDRRAYLVHIEADRHEGEIDAMLTADQHRRFHLYVTERASAVGLPRDDSHGTADVGTAGNIHTVGHTAGQEHPDEGTGSGQVRVKPSGNRGAAKPARPDGG